MDGSEDRTNRNLDGEDRTNRNLDGEDRTNRNLVGNLPQAVLHYCLKYPLHLIDHQHKIFLPFSEGKARASKFVIHMYRRRCMKIWIGSFFKKLRKWKKQNFKYVWHEIHGGESHKF